jgi:hypothetical protein
MPFISNDKILRYGADGQTNIGIAGSGILYGLGFSIGGVGDNGAPASHSARRPRTSCLRKLRMRQSISSESIPEVTIWILIAAITSAYRTVL